jgi:hypothetical protein
MLCGAAVSSNAVSGNVVSGNVVSGNVVSGRARPAAMPRLTGKSPKGGGTLKTRDFQSNLSKGEINGESVQEIIRRRR